MNRRSFFKFLGIGAATAVVAPKLLNNMVPEYYPESNSPIALEKIQKVYNEQKFTSGGSYKYVRVAPTTVPFRTGDLVRYKIEKRGGTIAYRVPKSPKWTKEEYYGIAINNALPGNYTFIQVNSDAITPYKNCTPHAFAWMKGTNA